jgi:hypothetical protein
MPRQTPNQAPANRWPGAMTSSQHVYEVRPRKDHRRVDLISDALPFGRLWYGEPSAYIHQSLRVRPAMEAGISGHVWSLEEIVRLLN